MQWSLHSDDDAVMSVARSASALGDVNEAAGNVPLSSAEAFDTASTSITMSGFVLSPVLTQLHSSDSDTVNTLLGLLLSVAAHAVGE